MDHIKLLTFVQHHSVLDFVYIMALYNKKKTCWMRHLLSQCDTNWASDINHLAAPQSSY